jgi:hypothetical protein
MIGPILPGESLAAIRSIPLAPPPVTFQPETPYLSANLPPADIREDFAGLAFEAGYDPQTLLDAMACWLPTATLADFMDDLAMGRL